MNKKILNFFHLTLIILSALSFVAGIKNAVKYPNGSFDYQYDTVKLYQMKVNPYDEYLNATGITEEMGLDVFYDGLEPNQFPSMLVFLLPFSFLSPYYANIAWMIFNVLCTALIIVLTRMLFWKNISVKLSILLFAVMIAGLGWRNNIGNGQHTIFSFAMLLLAFYLSDKNKTICAGIALAASFFKYTLTVPLALYLIHRKKYKEVVIAVFTHILFIFVSSLWLGDSVINMIVKPLKVSMGLAAHGYIDFSAIILPQTSIGLLLGLVVCGSLFIIAINNSLRSSRNKRNDYKFFVLLTFVSLIVTYHRVYDFFILIIPVGIVLNMLCSKEKEKDVLLLIISAALFLYPNFIQKILDVIVNRIPNLNSFVSSCTIVYAIVYYVCVLLTMVWYFRKGVKKSYGKNN